MMMDENMITEKRFKLRFSGFDDEWKKCKLKEISNIQDGTHATPNYTDEGIPFYSVETITSDAPPKFISNEEHQKLIKRCEPKFGDILLTRIGTLAKSKIVDWHEEFSIYVSLALLSEIKINNKFLNQYIQTEIYQKEFLKRSLLLAIPQKINLKDLNETIIKYPSKKEEEKIANFLDLIDKKIELLTHKYKKYVSFKKYLMQQIFTQKLRFDFVEVKLKDISKINKGEQLNKDVMIEDGKYYVLNGGKDPSGYTNEWNVSENTITISEGGNSCGYVNFNTEKFWSGGHCYYLSNLDENVDDYYLYNYLKFKEKFIMHLRVGSGLPNIQKRDIENIKIQIISKNNQNKISNLFLFVDKKINSIQIQKENFENFKKGLLQQMFV